MKSQIMRMNHDNISINRFWDVQYKPRAQNSNRPYEILTLSSKYRQDDIRLL